MKFKCEGGPLAGLAISDRPSAGDRVHRMQIKTARATGYYTLDRTRNPHVWVWVATKEGVTK